ncbi:MAG: endonuclease III [Tenericutes bacterium HGW-Tenericutes-6]|jgi:endonuclease-3|nr:MAG: endonuclease III [Tenericutes bacterium HGW-Tenericutes-6]
MSREQAILNALEMMFPNAHVELDHRNHFELLVAVVLSAQTTDIAVNKVTPKLFQVYPTPFDMAKALPHEIEPLIQTIGLYRNKAKHLVLLSQALIKKHQGIIPSKREDLEALPGVGRKTANVVLSNAFGIPALAVDTHVARVSVRLGLAKDKDSVLEIEKKLMRKFPKTLWLKLHHQLIFFGRYHCLAKKPKCYACPLYDLCKFEEKETFKANM